MCAIPYETDVFILHGSLWRGKKKTKKDKFDKVCNTLQVAYSINGVVLGFTKKLDEKYRLKKRFS